MAILVCGGAGYIGSHAVHALAAAGQEVVVVDNLQTGHAAAVAGKAAFVQGDIRDAACLDGIFRRFRIDGVMHFAADSQVGESMVDPLKYFNNNVGGMQSLLEAMVRHGVGRIVFSSSAAVYGEPDSVPISEDAPTRPTNPYGHSKLMMEAMMRWVSVAHGIRYVSLRYFNVAGALADGSIVRIGDKCLDDFVQAVYDQRVGDGAGIDALKLVYTPLNGTGLECVKKLLAKLGVTHVTVVPEQEKPNGDFPTCPYPNPEIREAMQKGLELCDTVKPDILLGTDPDCDRCGTAVPDGKGGYRLITGNEMGIILLDYICRTRKALGTMPEHPVAVTTIVSTDMATPVAAKYGVELRRTLTGFKFIGEQIGLLEAAGEADRYIFGFEESYGYLSGAHVRDKDAVNATLLVCEAAAWYAKQGMTLLDAINQLYAEFGCYRNALHSFAFEGESGMHTMDAIMKQLRQTPPTAIGGMAVESMVDYNTAGTGLPKANVLEFRLAGGAKLMVRPSGTEPKIKVYLSAVAPTEEAADAINDTLGKAAAALLKA